MPNTFISTQLPQNERLTKAQKDAKKKIKEMNSIFDEDKKNKYKTSKEVVKDTFKEQVSSSKISTKKKSISSLSSSSNTSFKDSSSFSSSNDDSDDEKHEKKKKSNKKKDNDE